MDNLIFGIIYVLTFINLCAFAFTIELRSDRLGEYNAYLDVIRTKKMLHRNGGLFQSSMTAVVLPYLIYRFIGGDKKTIFKMVPCFFYATMPAFAYLISRLFFGIPESITASAFVFSQFYFVFYPNMGRLSIGFGALSALVWAILAGNTYLTIPLVLLLVISHYGTTYFAIYTLALTWLGFLLTTNFGAEFDTLSVALVTLVVSQWIWHYFILSSVGYQCEQFIARVVCFDSPTLTRKIEQIFLDGVTIKSDKSNIWKNLFDMRSREPVVQAAFGKGFQHFTFPQRVEYLISWLMVILVSAGAIFIMISSDFPFLYRLLVGSSYSAVLLTLIIPHISVQYGMVRAYFTSLVFLTPCFVLGSSVLSETVGINKLVFIAAIIIVNLLSVSGILHSFFLIDKRVEFHKSKHPRFRQEVAYEYTNTRASVE